MAKCDVSEFYEIVKDYINHPKVLEMREYLHHGVNRYDHSFRVAYHTYRVTKRLHLNYVSATKAAMLHDFFLNEVERFPRAKRYRKHPSVAVINAKRYFTINSFEEDIILNHMFPITLIPPKSIEGLIVDFVDDVISIYEKCYSMKIDVKSFANGVVVLLLGVLR